MTVHRDRPASAAAGHRNFVYTTLMAVSLERRAHEYIKSLKRHLRLNKAARHDQYVGIIVGTREPGYLRLPAEGGAYVLMLVQSHCDAVAGTADGYSRIHLTALHRQRARVGIIGIIATLSSVCAEVLDSQPPLLEMAFHNLLERETGMIGT